MHFVLRHIGIVPIDHRFSLTRISGPGKCSCLSTSHLQQILIPCHLGHYLPLYYRSGSPTRRIHDCESKCLHNTKKRLTASVLNKKTKSLRVNALLSVFCVYSNSLQNNMQILRSRAAESIPDVLAFRGKWGQTEDKGCRARHHEVQTILKDRADGRKEVG